MSKEKRHLEQIKTGQRKETTKKQKTAQTAELERKGRINEERVYATMERPE